MSTQLRMHKDGRCTFDTCPFCWEEHEEISLWGMEETASAAIHDDYALPGDWYDPTDCRNCGLPAVDCTCEPYTNADRMEDVEAHRPMGDGGATYLED